MPQAHRIQEQQGLPLQGLAPAAIQQQEQQQQACPMRLAVLLLMLLRPVAWLMAVYLSRQERGPTPTQQQATQLGTRLPLQLVLALHMTQPLNRGQTVLVHWSRAAALLREQTAVGTVAAAAAGVQPARAMQRQLQSQRQDPTAAAAAGTALGQRQVFLRTLGPAAAMGLLLTPLLLCQMQAVLMQPVPLLHTTGMPVQQLVLRTQAPKTAAVQTLVLAHTAGMGSRASTAAAQATTTT
jgi:hypothetical protein